MILCGLNFVCVAIVVKVMGNVLPPVEMAFIRYVIGLFFFVPVIRPILQARISTGEFVLFSIRGAAHAAGVALWFYAMTQITIAEVTALNYLSPVFITVGAALVLGERLAFRRIVAVLLGLLGCLIILRPGFREISYGHLAILATSLMFSVSYLIAKRLTDHLSPTVIVGMLSITVAIALAPFALAVWVWPTVWHLFGLLLVAFFATMSHVTMTMSFRAAPISVTQPVVFLQLVWATLVGILAFGEAVDFFVLAGGLVIVGSVSYIALREAVQKSRLRGAARPK